MAWGALLDEGLDADWVELLEHWDDLASSLVPSRPSPGDTFGPDAMSSRVETLRDQGWLEFPSDEDTPDALYFAAIERFHRRDLPIPVPLLELWSAIRLLTRLDGSAARDLLDRTVAGDAAPVLAIASVFEPGTSGWVPFGDAATVLVARDDGEGVVLHAVDPEGPGVVANAPDPTLPSVRVTGAGIELGRLDAAALARLRGELLVAQSSALAGQAEAMMIATSDYLAVRHQFGVPVGSFQALRHRAADLATEVYTAHRLARHAAAALAQHPQPHMLGLLAKSFVANAAIRMASEAVQLHGGIGFTWEGGVHFGLKRTMHIAMTGPTAGECDDLLGRWAVEAPALHWAGGLEDAR